MASALSTYKELQREPKILVKVKNYCTWTLVPEPIELTEGVTNSPLPTLFPGEEGGWVASKENSLIPSGTEGFALFHLSNHGSCAIYWRVGQMDGFERMPNALGIGCDKGISKIKQWKKVINRSLKTQCDLDNFYYQEYAQTHPVMQFCNDNVCIQGTLFSALKGEAIVEIIPRDVNHVAPSMVEKIHQETINSIFKPYKKGCVAGGTAVASNPKLAILMAVLYALLR